MLAAIIALFVMAAIIGAFLYIRILNHRRRPNLFLFLHGAFAATALFLLIYYFTFHTEGKVPKASIFFFSVAVIIGLFMVITDKLFRRPIPYYYPLIHAGAAVTGLTLLVIYVIKHL